MRVEPHGVGSVLHIIKRGARGMEIVRDQSDHWRFVRSLFLLNDHFQDPNRSGGKWRKSDLRHLVGKEMFTRPRQWPPRKPLVSIVAWTLMRNHFHILVQEISEGGTAKFLQRLCGSMTLAFNEKYEETGSIFQGAYQSRTVDTDEYLQYVHAYIVVKNTLENYPGGLKKVLNNFDAAWTWALEHYPFSSLRTSATGIESPIIDMRAFQSLGFAHGNFKRFAKSMLATHMQTRDDLIEFKALQLEEW